VSIDIDFQDSLPKRSSWLDSKLLNCWVCYLGLCFVRSEHDFFFFVLQEERPRDLELLRELDRVGRGKPRLSSSSFTCSSLALFVFSQFWKYLCLWWLWRPPQEVACSY
jgi:hypothetical protein